AKRRGHGEGCIRERVDGRWEALVSLPNGKRKSFFGKTRKEALDKLRAALRDLDAGLDIAAGTQTVGDFLDRWLADVVEPSVRPSTHRGYESVIRCHLKPAFGHVRLTKLTPQHVQNLLNDQSKAGLAPRSVQLTRATLRRALSYAVKWSLVPRNVATLVEPPRTIRTQVHPLSAEQARHLIEATKDHRPGPVIHLAIASGLRQGELLGLGWDDVDLAGGSLTVRRSLQRMNGTPRLVEPKTGLSRRTVNLPASAAAMLRAHQDRERFERQAAGDAWERGPALVGLVFTNSTGAPLHCTSVTHTFHDLLEGAGLPRQRFHDLRHCCASLMLASGEHPRVVMETLGHSQISLTMNTYSHVMPAAQRDAADRLDALLTATS
ncbi:MAG: tyrosine-type recombinase/integrase, partial [Thermomicrobiales bacterium]